MKAFIASNIFVNKIDTRMLLKFLNRNFKWIFYTVVSFEYLSREWITFSKKLLNESATLD